MTIELKPAGVEIPVAALIFVKIPAKTVIVIDDDRVFRCWIFALGNMSFESRVAGGDRGPLRCQRRCSSSSSTRLLPKKASTSRVIAIRVQRTALTPRQP